MPAVRDCIEALPHLSLCDMFNHRQKPGLDNAGAS
jgi:hypothetical protein